MHQDKRCDAYPAFFGLSSLFCFPIVAMCPVLARYAHGVSQGSPLLYFLYKNSIKRYIHENYHDLGR